MLKRCKLNNAECNAQSFESVRTKHGMCFQLRIPRQKQTHLEMILDPEESEYVLPNDGFTGFLIALNCSTSDQSEFFIGSGFHNMIRISSAAPHNGVACDSEGSQLQVDSITQTVRSALYQSFFPRDDSGHSTADAEREALSRLIQQRAFLRYMNRTAFEKVVQLARDLTSIHVAAGFIADLIRQATHALKVETTIVPQQSGCSADLHRIASRLLVDFLEAQERWSDFSPASASSSLFTSGLVIDSAPLVNTSVNADVELRLVECFFAAQSIGTRLQSHLRDLIQSLLEIFAPRGLNPDPPGSDRTSNSPASPLLSSREVFQPLSVSELLTTGNVTVCRRVQSVYRARTTLLGERASAVVALIDRLNARLHTLTAENRETRAHFSLSQSARHNAPYPVASTVSLWLTLILVIELHRKNFRERRTQLLRLHHLPLNVGAATAATSATSVHENNANPLSTEIYDHCNLVESQSIPPKLIQIKEGDPPEMWLTVPTSMLEMTTHLLPTHRMPPTILYKRQTSQKPSKTTRSHVELLEPSASASSSTQTVILDNLQNRF
uniref:Amiloride sensitive cation channel 4 A n=1 Tax=Echinococcus granulosus TaxID=6210 RepID=A0A068W725_ECHGR|nr:amiloride sensitive cation channel 4 A [Echinococcus granulosus]